MPIGRFPQVVEHGGDVDFGGRFARVAARKGKIALEHLPHLIDVSLQKFAVG